ncbi:Ig-like domain-containing protein [Streptomyces luteireticuli]|uniref:L,D-transpeptidase n=1 Tax=Streptomyces luteireticuli TaxID=173858 RepID=UPI0035593696
MDNYTKYLIAALALCGLLVINTIACEAKKENKERTRTTHTTAEDTSGPLIKFRQRDGSTTAGITADGAGVSVPNGELTQVHMTTQDGTEIPGSLASDRRSWKPNKDLELGTTYTITANAADENNGTVHGASVSFTTADPEHSTIVTCTPQNGSTVGVGMPVSLTFSRPIHYREAVLSGITVHSSSGQQAIGHWLGDRRLDFRPREYWHPHSQITVDISLDGLETSPGVQGVQNETVRFSTGHAQISTLDVRSHRMTVTRDGELLRILPVSAGSSSHPTYNGTLVISEKHQEIRMNGASVGFPEEQGGYDIPDVPHAMRLTDSGTFVHGNYWTPKNAFGTTNTSHGCIGLEDTQGTPDPHTPAAWFFDHSRPGDIIIVSGSTAPVVDPANGLNSWNMDWATWSASTQVPFTTRTCTRVAEWWQRKMESFV